MQPSAKELVHRVVLSYLTAESSGSVEEFHVVFDHVYETLSRPSIDDDDHTTAEGGARGFDPGLVQQGLVTLACFVAIRLVEAAVKAQMKPMLSKQVKDVADRLARQTTKPDLVRRMQQEVERVIAEL